MKFVWTRDVRRWFFKLFLVEYILFIRILKRAVSLETCNSRLKNLGRIVEAGGFIAF